MMSDNHIDDPCDSVIGDDLDGWIKYDSGGLRKENNGEGLEGSQGDRHQDSWIRFDND